MSNEDTSASDTLLLEPEKKGLDSLLLPAALAAGGAALLYTAATRSKEKKSKKSAPSADPTEVVFSTNYGGYSMGKDYEELVLEPYLAEQAEDGDLVLLSEGGASLNKALVQSTRTLVISAFKATHKVKVGNEMVQISSLPQDKTGVQKFNAWIESTTKAFQENY